MTEQELARVLVALEALKGSIDKLSGRIDGIEAARSLARFDQDEWRAEVRDELHEIHKQTKATNGDVTELKLWRARVNGAASVFSWWKTAVAGVAIAGALYLVSHAA